MKDITGLLSQSTSTVVEHIAFVGSGNETQTITLLVYSTREEAEQYFTDGARVSQYRFELNGRGWLVTNLKFDSQQFGGLCITINAELDRNSYIQQSELARAQAWAKEQNVKGTLTGDVLKNALPMAEAEQDALNVIAEYNDLINESRAKNDAELKVLDDRIHALTVLREQRVEAFKRWLADAEELHTEALTAAQDALVDRGDSSADSDSDCD